MENNIAQHDAFTPGLKAYRAYVHDTSAGDYSGTKLRAIIDDFGPILTQHLAEEIDTLLALDKYGGKQVLKLWHDFEDHLHATIEDKVWP